MRFDNEVQRALAFAIRQIELYLEPKCEECGYSAARQKCANDLGGYCKANEQEDKLAFDRVIEILQKEAGLNKQPMWGWRHKAPLQRMFTLSEEEQNLLHDLYDQHQEGKVHKVRSLDRRLSSLCSKGVLSLSAQSSIFTYAISPRGIAWAEELFGSGSLVKAQGL